MKIKFALAAAAALLTSTTAGYAADMAVKAPLLSPAPVWSWTGFYGGVHIGAGWGTTESTLTRLSVGAPINLNVPLNFPFSQNSRSGFLGGAQAGYNWQSGWLVLGVQGDIAGTNIRGTTPCLVLLSCTSETNWLATVSGRVGAVVLDRGLVYVKGGAAWMNTDHRVNLPVVANTQLTSASSDTFGWLLGFGTEWMITRNWTAFVEYNYIEFDKKNEAFPINVGGVRAIPFTVNADLTNKLSIAKAGVNYKFDWGTPVVARY
jgi:outer membrane immunogenic protein